MKNWILSMLLILVTFSSRGIAQSKDSLVGTWKLISATNTTEKGVIADAYGENPTGFLTDTPDGRMMVIIASSGRKPLSVLPGPLQERAEAFSTFAAYAGRYTLSGDRVIHHIEADLRQDRVNTDQVRFIVKLQDNRVTLRTPLGVATNGVRQTQELVWERMKPDAAGH